MIASAVRIVFSHFFSMFPLQCCKIGDVSAAAFLFEEMTSLIDFVPKVPPYNTSMGFLQIHLRSLQLEAKLKHCQ